jgi:hypothetical protein
MKNYLYLSMKEFYHENKHKLSHPYITIFYAYTMMMISITKTLLSLLSHVYKIYEKT